MTITPHSSLSGSYGGTGGGGETVIGPPGPQGSTGATGDPGFVEGGVYGLVSQEVQPSDFVEFDQVVFDSSTYLQGGEVVIPSGVERIRFSGTIQVTDDSNEVGTIGLYHNGLHVGYVTSDSNFTTFAFSLISVSEGDTFSMANLNSSSKTLGAATQLIAERIK